MSAVLIVVVILLVAVFGVFAISMRSSSKSDKE